MKLTGPTSIVAWVGLLLAIAVQPLLVTSIVTSYEKLRILVETGDDALIRGIEDKIKEDEERIKNLTTILAQYFQTPNQDYQFQVDHPNDFYLLIKHYINSWYNGDIDEELLPVVEEVIKNQNITFPVVDNFGDAVLSLVRLQHVYRLKAKDMFEGNYLGYMGPALETEDAYLLGKQAFMTDNLPESKEWLQMSVDMLTEAMENHKQDLSEDGETSFEILQEDYFWSLCLLGRAHFYMNNTEEAREVYEKCLASGLTDIEDMDELGKELEADNFTKLLEKYHPKVNDDDENTTALCSRGKDHRVSVVRPYHVCRYKSDPFIPYRRFREEILSTSPYASVFYDVIHDAEIEKLKDIVTEAGLTRAHIVGSGQGQVSDIRTGDLGWVWDDQNPLVDLVAQRVKAFTRLEVTIGKDTKSSAEALQVVNYGMGGHYDVHMDAFPNHGIQNRLATVLFYLSDVEKGGATIFPKVGISVTPVKGMALLWYSFPPDMKDRDLDTHHAGCPVMIGNKWIANKWIWTYGNTFRRPCGPSPQSRQLDVEKIVSLDALKQTI